MKDKGIPITLDTDRNLIFTLNVLEKCVQRYGKMDNILNESLKNVTEIKWLATEMLNEDAEIWNDEHPDNKKQLLTEKKLGRYITGIGGANELLNKVQKAMLAGLPEDKVKEVEDMAEEIEKNLMAAQRKKISGK